VDLLPARADQRGDRHLDAAHAGDDGDRDRAAFGHQPPGRRHPGADPDGGRRDGRAVRRARRPAHARRAPAAAARHPGACGRRALLRRSGGAAGDPVFDSHVGGAAVRGAPPVLAAAVIALAATPAAATERLVSSLSNHVIQITSSFVGTSLVLFGIVERDAESPPRRGSYDVVATVKGPPEILVVRRKARVVGIWVNTDSRTFVQVPSYLAVLSSRPVEAIVPLDVARRLQLGVRRTLLPQQIGPDTADVVRDDPFRGAFLKLQEDRGLYLEKPGAINFQ